MLGTSALALDPHGFAGDKIFVPGGITGDRTDAKQKGACAACTSAFAVVLGSFRTPWRGSSDKLARRDDVQSLM